MPRELRFSDGHKEAVAMPAENSRISRIVKRYSGKPYKVFVDESFRSFFGFDVRTGYLCYAAVGIPAEEYEYLKRSMAKIFAQYERVRNWGS